MIAMTAWNVGGNMSPALRDADIRLALHDWLARKHAGSTDTALIHELKMPRPSARIDLAVVNGSMIGYEIKSDCDTLVRLPRQVAAYSKVFDEVSLVTTQTHLKSVRKQIPSWWGIITPRVMDGRIELVAKRKMKKNPAASNAALLHMLCKKELLNLLAAHSDQKGVRGVRKADLIGIILENVASSVLRDSARALLRKRSNAVGMVLS